jgi:hypothetical protein
MTKLHPVTIQVSGRFQYVYGQHKNVNKRSARNKSFFYGFFFSVRQGKM